MLNRIILMGRLTRDPEFRSTQSGTPVASFSLAVERDFKDKATGKKVTDFIDIVAWRQTAEFVSKFFTKGRMAVEEHNGYCARCIRNRYPRDLYEPKREALNET